MKISNVAWLFCLCIIHFSFALWWFKVQAALSPSWTDLARNSLQCFSVVDQLTVMAPSLEVALSWWSHCLAVCSPVANWVDWAPWLSRLSLCFCAEVAAQTQLQTKVQFCSVYYSASRFNISLWGLLFPVSMLHPRVNVPRATPGTTNQLMPSVMDLCFEMPFANLGILKKRKLRRLILGIVITAGLFSVLIKEVLVRNQGCTLQGLSKQLQQKQKQSQKKVFVLDIVLKRPKHPPPPPNRCPPMLL